MICRANLFGRGIGGRKGAETRLVCRVCSASAFGDAKSKSVGAVRCDQKFGCLLP